MKKVFFVLCMIFVLAGCEKSDNYFNISKDKELLSLTGRTLEFSVNDYFSDEAEDDWFTYMPEEIYGKYIPEAIIGDLGCYHEFEYEATSTYSDGKIDYSVNNLANEFSKESSWVEGVEGYGIGEKITIYMAELSDTVSLSGDLDSGYYFDKMPNGKSNATQSYKASLDGIYIVNGYTATEELWKANSRVKKLKLIIDDKKEYILELEDTMQPQVFSVDYNTESYGKLNPIKAEFEILEVYKGDKYEDTALNTLIINCSSNIPKGR